jgi:DNA replication protein DnaC
MDFDFSRFEKLFQPDGTGPCPGCGAEIQFFLSSGRRIGECTPCKTAEDARLKIERRREICFGVWHDVTPVNFLQTIDPMRIAASIRPALNLDGTSGVGFSGSSGGGKTRVAYALLRKAAEQGMRPYSVSASEYRLAAANRHHSDNAIRNESTAILRNARNCQALLIDDIGKGASTAVGDEALYDLLNERRDNERLTFWTTNGSGEWLKKRLGPDMGPAILRRMVDLVTTADGRRQIFVCDGKPEEDK